MKKKGGIVLGLIPARGGSKGVKNKNIRTVHGKPLIGYAVERGLSCSSICHMIVSTDSSEIAEISKKYGAEVPFMRPPELAKDSTPMMPVLEHALKKCEILYNSNIKCIVLIDATSPLTTTTDLENCINIFEDGDYDAVISASPSKRNPYFNMVIQENGYIKLASEPEVPITRRQDCPPIYDLNNSIWVFSRKAVLEMKSRIPEKSTIYKMDEDRCVDVDSELDLKILEVLMKEKNV